MDYVKTIYLFSAYCLKEDIPNDIKNIIVAFLCHHYYDKINITFNDSGKYSITYNDHLFLFGPWSSKMINYASTKHIDYFKYDIDGKFIALFNSKVREDCNSNFGLYLLNHGIDDIRDMISFYGGYYILSGQRIYKIFNYNNIQIECVCAVPYGTIKMRYVWDKFYILNKNNILQVLGCSKNMEDNIFPYKVYSFDIWQNNSSFGIIIASEHGTYIIQSNEKKKFIHYGFKHKKLLYDGIVTHVFCNMYDTILIKIDGTVVCVQHMWTCRPKLIPIILPERAIYAECNYNDLIIVSQNGHYKINTSCSSNVGIPKLIPFPNHI